MPVPLFGWSQTAQRFRELAEKYASTPASLLIIGAPGVGKRTMANAWQCAADRDDLPIVNLDNDFEAVPQPCIALTSRTLPHDERCIHLGRNNSVPQKAVAKCLKEPALNSSLVRQFQRRLYVPPLKERLIDLLAVLYYWNERKLPADFGCRFSSINSGLIHMMFAVEDWPNNLDEVTSFLVESGSIARQQSGRSEEESLIELPSLEDRNDFRLFDGVRSKTKIEGESVGDGEWVSWNKEVPFERLPDVATRGFLWSFGPDDAYDRTVQDSNDPFPPLGPDKTWDVEEGYSASDLCRITLGGYIQGFGVSEGPRYSELMKTLGTCSTFGTTFASLESGLQIHPHDVCLDVVDGLHSIRAMASEPDDGISTWVREKFNHARQKLAKPLTPPDQIGVGSKVDTDNEALPPDGHYSVTQLAEYFHVEKSVLRKRLERWRPKHDDSWKEVENSGSRKAKYLYLLSAVRSIIDDMRRKQGVSSAHYRPLLENSC